MELTLEQACPQCGASIDLDETDLLIECPFCNVKSYLFRNDYFRYILPHKALQKEILYVPYLRFKGSVYFCHDLSIGHRIVDITHIGLDFKKFPVSLGLRPQAMKLKFVSPDSDGKFLRFSLKAGDILAKAGNISSQHNAGKMLHRAYIGERLSIIYLPVYVENDTIIDAILDRPVLKVSKPCNILKELINKKAIRPLSFLSTLCPQCGWNLEGERDSIVLTCNNCGSIWEAKDGKFKQVHAFCVSGPTEDAIYLPFWKNLVQIHGVNINLFADFIRLTNQTRILGKEWDEVGMCFWSPAFKIRPKIFLNLSRQFTIFQKGFRLKEDLPNKGLYPATLPLGEAQQAMKLILASSAIQKKNIFPYLGSTRFSIKSSSLIYLPFKEMAHEMFQEEMGISINKNALNFGRQL